LNVAAKIHFGKDAKYSLRSSRDSISDGYRLVSFNLESGKIDILSARLTHQR